jgi:DNA-binding NtrC family response regulator
MNIGLGSKRKTILLVDADPHARAVLRNALEAAGFSVGEAATAREGGTNRHPCQAGCDPCGSDHGHD